MTGVRDIPVVLDNKLEIPIGRAEIDADGNIIVHISAGALVRDLEYLVSVDQILALSFGVTYKRADNANAD